MRLTASAPTVLLLAFTCFAANPADAIAQSRGQASARDAVTVVACVVREADYVRSAVADSAASAVLQLLLANAQSGTPTYSLTGVREQELARLLGRRIQITGTVERPRTTPVVTTADGSRTGLVNTEAVGATGTTPDGAAAHEPSDALSTTVQAGKVAEPVAKASDPAYRVATLPRLNATSYREVSGACRMPAAETPTVSARAAAQRQAAAPGARLVQPSQPPHASSMTFRGCLVRRTPGGTALTATGDRFDPLALTNAAIVDTRSPAGSGGVPGSTPTASGTGTVPGPVATTGAAPQDAGRLALALGVSTAQQGELARLVGERVEIVGTLGDDTSDARATRGADSTPEPAGAGVTGRIEPRADAAHPSAPGRLLSVTSFRALGGACN